MVEDRPIFLFDLAISCGDDGTREGGRFGGGEVGVPLMGGKSRRGVV